MTEIGACAELSEMLSCPMDPETGFATQGDYLRSISDDATRDVLERHASDLDWLGSYGDYYCKALPGYAWSIMLQVLMDGLAGGPLRSPEKAICEALEVDFANFIAAYS